MTKPHYRLTASGEVVRAIRAGDGFQNLVANLGTARDKAAASGYVDHELSDAELIAAYRTSSVARKIVDMPAEDGVREWRAWQAEADQISRIEKLEKRLGLQRKVMEARKKARLFGGAAIYIGTRDPNVARPLDPERIGEDGLQYLTVLTRRQLQAAEMQRDPRQPGYGLPVSYRLAAETGSVDIHPTRLVLFRGEDHPDDDLASARQGWGDSVLTACLEKVKHLDATVANVASLVFEAKVDVIKIRDFTAGLRDGGEAYERLMLRRMGLASVAKGINGALLMDAEEDYQQKTASFGTLPDVMDRFMQVVSSAASIPMTLLFGMSPGGLNATGDSDIRGYYDRVKAEQTLDVGPSLEILDECLIRSALGGRPEEVHYRWVPLWQPTEKERAEVGRMLAETLKIGREIGAASDDALGRTYVNALTESGAFPGLEAADEEFPLEEPAGPLESGVMPTASDDPEQTVDAVPRTLYVRRDVLNADEILNWAKAQGFKTTLPADDLHVTIAYSRNAVDWMKAGEAWQERVEIAPGGARLMEQFGEARVLLFASAELSWRHEEFKRAGASWDHPEYQPHITITYAAKAPDISQVEPYRGRIVLGPEIFAEINPKWMEGVTEQ